MKKSVMKLPALLTAVIMLVPFPVSAEEELEPAEPIEESEWEEIYPVSEYHAEWSIGNRSAFPGDNINIPVCVMADAEEALALNSFRFGINLPEELTYIGYQWGSAYMEMSQGLEETNLEFSGTNPAGTDIEAMNGETLLYLYFKIPEDVQPGRYPITFQGDAEALKSDRNSVINLTLTDGCVDVLPAEITLTLGDANLDGKVNILDVITINKAVLGKETIDENQLAVIDFNQNEKPDSEEALAVLKFIVGLTDSFDMIS